MFNRIKTAALLCLTMLFASSALAFIPHNTFHPEQPLSTDQTHQTQTDHPEKNRVGGFQVEVVIEAGFLPLQDAETQQVKWVKAVRCASGRLYFISTDPLGIDGGVNLYAYGNLNPLAFVDPYGLCAESGSSWGSKISGALDQLYAGHLQSEQNYAQKTAAYYNSSDYAEYSQSGFHKTAVFLQDMNEAIGTKVAVAAMAYSFATMPASVSTPYGRAIQSSSAGSQAALQEVRSGATVYRQGSFGVQNTADAQFWSMNNPASTPGYAGQMGMPAGSGAADWMMGGTVRSGASVITRPAPAGPGGVNLGGKIESVVNPGGVQANWFHMP